MKSDFFTLEYLERKKNQFVDFNKINLPRSPYENVLSDLEELRITKLVLSSKSFEELIKGLKTLHHIDFIPVEKFIDDIKAIQEPTRDALIYGLVRQKIDKLPQTYGLRQKVYELVHKV